MNLLEVKNICKIYGSGETPIKALKNINFSVPKRRVCSDYRGKRFGKKHTAEYDRRA